MADCGIDSGNFFIAFDIVHGCKTPRGDANCLARIERTLGDAPFLALDARRTLQHTTMDRRGAFMCQHSDGRVGEESPKET